MGGTPSRSFLAISDSEGNEKERIFLTQAILSFSEPVFVGAVDDVHDPMAVQIVFLPDTAEILLSTKVPEEEVVRAGFDLGNWILEVFTGRITIEPDCRFYFLAREVFLLVLLLEEVEEGLCDRYARFKELPSFQPYQAR